LRATKSGSRVHCRYSIKRSTVRDGFKETYNNFFKIVFNFLN